MLGLWVYLGANGCASAPEPSALSPKLRSIDAVDLARQSQTPPVTIEEATQEVEKNLTDSNAVNPVPLTLTQVRTAALKYNLDLKVQCVEPSLAELSLDAERAKFEAVFWSSAEYDYYDPCNSPVIHYWDSEVGISQPLPTGGTLEVSLPLSDSHPGGVATAQASVSYVQSLWQGAGTRINTHSIRIAEHQRNQISAQTKEAIIEVLAYADQVYWNYYATCKTLEVRREQYRLAQNQLDQARKKVASGAAAATEIVRAEAGLSSRLEAVINAESNVESVARQLRRIMNRPDLSLEQTLRLVPQTDPAPLGLDLNSEDLIKQALAQRMDVMNLEESRRIQDLRLELARNATRPDLQLSYSYTGTGYDHNVSSALNQWPSNSSDSHAVGLYASIPVGNRAARANLRQAQLIKLQLETRKTRLEQTIRQEVYEAVSDLERDWKRILAAEQGVVSAVRDYKVDQSQFQLGASTSTDVLYSASRLADAQLARINAFASYEISQIELARVTGVLLGKDQIQIDQACPKKMQ